MALQYHFQVGNHQDTQLTVQNPIHGYQFCVYTYDQDPVHHPDELFTTFKGISIDYQFVVNAEGILYNCLRSCWYLCCMQELMKGTLTWGGASCEVPGCDAVLSGNTTTAETTSVYCFHQKKCVKKTGPGISRQIDCERSNRNVAASKKSVGDWVLFASVNDQEDDQLWVG